MIGWIIVMLILVGSVSMIIYDIRRSWINSTGGACFGGIILFLLSTVILINWYNANLKIPYTYKQLNKTISEVTALTSKSTLVMSEIQINQTLANLIKERNELLQTVEINNVNPFALFKIILRE